MSEIDYFGDLKNGSVQGRESGRPATFDVCPRRGSLRCMVPLASRKSARMPGWREPPTAWGYRRSIEPPCSLPQADHIDDRSRSAAIRSRRNCTSIASLGLTVCFVSISNSLRPSEIGTPSTTLISIPPSAARA
jgi:hypothetical protein